jgi:hypothetical protein
MKIDFTITIPTTSDIELEIRQISDDVVVLNPGVNKVGVSKKNLTEAFAKAQELYEKYVKQTQTTEEKKPATPMNFNDVEYGDET